MTHTERLRKLLSEGGEARLLGSRDDYLKWLETNASWLVAAALKATTFRDKLSHNAALAMAETARTLREAHLTVEVETDSECDRLRAIFRDQAENVLVEVQFDIDPVGNAKVHALTGPHPTSEAINAASALIQALTKLL